MSNQNQPAATREAYENYFDALKSLEFSKELDAFGTNMLIKVISTTEADWINSVISSALEEEEEAKQIYSIAESIRIEYIGNTESDIKRLSEAVSSMLDGDKIKVNPILDYLNGFIYGIDLFDVAKELLIRYKQRISNSTAVIS